MDQNVKKYKFYCLDAQHCSSFVARMLINPRRACAARVTVVGSVCVSVTFDLPSRMSNRAINRRAY